MLDHADTDDCQARILSRELTEITLAKLARTLSSASLNNSLSKETDFDGTTVAAQSNGDAPREECGCEEDQPGNQTHEQIV